MSPRSTWPPAAAIVSAAMGALGATPVSSSTAQPPTTRSSGMSSVVGPSGRMWLCASMWV